MCKKNCKRWYLLLTTSVFCRFCSLEFWRNILTVLVTSKINPTGYHTKETMSRYVHIVIYMPNPSGYHAQGQYVPLSCRCRDRCCSITIPCRNFTSARIVENLSDGRLGCVVTGTGFTAIAFRSHARYAATAWKICTACAAIWLRNTRCRKTTVVTSANASSATRECLCGICWACTGVRDFWPIFFIRFLFKC